MNGKGATMIVTMISSAVSTSAAFGPWREICAVRMLRRVSIVGEAPSREMLEWMIRCV